MTVGGFDEFGAIEKAAWERKAAAYSEEFAIVTRQANAVVLDAVGPVSKRSLIDMCCGDGRFVADAVRSGADAIGGDFSRAMINQARTRYPGFGFEVADAMAIDQPDSLFDIYTCLFGFWHLPDPDAALSEAFRVLIPGGRIAITNWRTPDDGNRWMGLLGDLVSKHGHPDVPLPSAPPPYRFSEAAPARAAFEAAGFTGIEFVNANAKWHGNDGRQFLDMVFRTVVRAPMMVQVQPIDIQERIVSDFVREINRDLDDGQLSVDWPYVVITAKKPEK